MLLLLIRHSCYSALHPLHLPVRDNQSTYSRFSSAAACVWLAAQSFRLHCRSTHETPTPSARVATTQYTNCYIALRPPSALPAKHLHSTRSRLRAFSRYTSQTQALRRLTARVPPHSRSAITPSYFLSAPAV
jgi:hypothetical protein